MKESERQREMRDKAEHQRQWWMSEQHRKLVRAVKEWMWRKRGR